jgi:hypothetical protein
MLPKYARSSALAVLRWSPVTQVLTAGLGLGFVIAVVSTAWHKQYEPVRIIHGPTVADQATTTGESSSAAATTRSAVDAGLTSPRRATVTDTDTDFESLDATTTTTRLTSHTTTKPTSSASVSSPAPSIVTTSTSPTPTTTTKTHPGPKTSTP